MKSFQQMPIWIKLVSTMSLITIFSATIVGLVMVYSTNRNADLVGLSTAEAISNQIVAVRSFYTTHVVEPAQSAGMEVSYDFAEKERTIPLPATMVKALGDEIRNAYPGTDIRLYSRYPFPHRKATEQYDEFELEALAALEADPETPFYRLEELNDRRTMRYAVADRMSKSCVGCHNTHPESPKTDWQIEDVRGVVEVVVPVDEARADFHAASILQGAVVLLSFIVIIGSNGLVMWGVNSTLKQTIVSVSTTSDQIGSTVQTQDRLSSDLAAAMNETLTTMDLMNRSAQASADQASSGAGETARSLSLAQEGVDSVQQSLKAMSELKVGVSQLSNQISSLSDRVEQIGEMSTAVAGLANQTNMLAVNAAVEAAHAGEHGRGFAVVASEIRKLADQSTESVARISDVVSDIREATNSAVLASAEGAKVVDQTMLQAQTINEVFDHLAASIGRAAESVEQISLNAKEQASGINQVVETIESLNESARQSSEGTGRVSDGLRTLDEIVVRLKSLAGVEASRTDSGKR